MRFILLSCLNLFWLGSATALSPSNANFSIVVDSIHHVNCRYATGYVAIHATGGAGPYTYAWSNGSTGTVDSTLVPGTYDITATDANSNTATISVTILEDITPPVANAGLDDTVPCSNTILTLMGTGSSTGPDFRYLWTASNGGAFKSRADTITPVIKHAGTFDLLVTDITNGCTATDEVIISYLHNPPVVTAANDTFTCSQPLVTLNSTFQQNNTTFVWNGPNGFVSHLLHPQVNVAGTYIFKVTDTITTCINTANAVIKADTARPVFPVTGGVINCAMPTIQLSGTATPSGVTFFWKGPFGFTSTLQNPIVSAPGTYEVTVTNPENGCTRRNSATVTPDFTPPTAAAGVSGAITCVSSMVQLLGSGTPVGITYSWVGPGGFTSNIANPVTTVAGTYTLTTTNPTNGCTASASTVVMLNTTPPGVTASGGVRTCANPSVTLQANSNTPGITYKWTGPGGFMSTLQNPVVSVSGTYNVVVTNPANGCTSFATTSVTQNFTPPTVSATTAMINCYNPMPHVVATGSPSGCSFLWTGPNGFTSNVYNPVVTQMGTYTVTATSPVNGCTAATSIYVSENLETPTVYAGEDRTLNCNFTTILANPIGTSTGSNITYLWTTFDGNIQSGATTLYARFDQPGYYTLTVTNTTSGCSAKDSMEVTQTPPLTANAVQLNGISCNGGNNGSVKVTPGGGAWPYTYLWSNGSTSSMLSGLTAGVYTVTVNDAQGCSATGSVTVTQPAALVVNITATGQTQQGVNNGTATASPSGGTFPYSAQWSNGSNMFMITNLAPGQYTVTVTDNNGCTKSNVATVNAVNCTISGTAAATDLNCADSNTGSASVTLTGAVSPVTFAWSNGGQTQGISNLAAGTYTVTATGANGCSVVLTTQVTSPLPLVLSVDSHTNINCAGSQNGTAMVSASGGTAPYSFLWSNGSTSQAISGLAAGTYTCTVTDSKGCTAVNSTQITSPAALTLAVGSLSNPPCVDSQNGAVTMNAGGGTSPYSFAWSSGAAGMTISGLSAGNYTCTVTDAAGCTKTQSAQIAISDHTPPQLILKNATVFLDANGTVSVTAAQFDNGSFDESCSIASLTVSPTNFDCSQTGTHTVTLTATDKNGNSATGTATVTVSDNIAPTITCPANITASACASSVTFNIPAVQDNCSQNGTPVLVNGLPSGSAFPTGITQEQFSFTDGGGNTATCSFTVTVSGSGTLAISATPATCSGSCDGMVQLNVVSGAPPASVLWSNGQTGLSLANLCPGAYTATVTDAAGCTQNFSAQVTFSDTQAPVITCPPNVETGYCAPAATFLQPQVMDNCPVDLQQLTLVNGLPSGSTFPMGVTTETFRYTDGGGNSSECSFTITVHSAPVINVSAVQATCAGVCNGSAMVSVNGSAGNFGVLWSNGVAGPVISNLCAGFYSATVVDADGCQQTESVVIAEPQPLSLAFTQVIDDFNNDSSGSITITISGGTPPYNYLWSQNGVPFANTKDIYNLHAAIYTLAVTDANGCAFNAPPFTVQGSSVGATEPDRQLNWKVYPNPAHSELYLQVDPGQTGKEAMLHLYNTAGQMVLEQGISPGNGEPVRVDLSGIPDGVLMLRLSGEHGTATKIVVKGD